MWTILRANYISNSGASTIYTILLFLFSVGTKLITPLDALAAFFA